MRTTQTVVSKRGIRLDIMYTRLVNSIEEFFLGNELLSYQIDLLWKS